MIPDTLLPYRLKLERSLNILAADQNWATSSDHRALLGLTLKVHSSWLLAPAALGAPYSARRGSPVSRPFAKGALPLSGLPWPRNRYARWWRGILGVCAPRISTGQAATARTDGERG